MSNTDFGPETPDGPESEFSYRPVSEPLKVLLLARTVEKGNSFIAHVEAEFDDDDAEPVTLWGKTYKAFDWSIATSKSDLPTIPSLSLDTSSMLIVEVDTIESMTEFSENDVLAYTVEGAGRCTVDQFTDNQRIDPWVV